jgi:hypothetical protein
MIAAFFLPARAPHLTDAAQVLIAWQGRLGRVAMLPDTGVALRRHDNPLHLLVSTGIIASSSVQTLVSLPYWRGLACSKSFKRDIASSLKAAWILCGWLEHRSRQASPRSLKAPITSRTVSSSQPTASAMAGAYWPRLAANRIWQRRSTKASLERKPASNCFRSSSVIARSRMGSLMYPILPSFSLPRRPVLFLH